MSLLSTAQLSPKVAWRREAIPTIRGSRRIDEVDRPVDRRLIEIIPDAQLVWENLLDVANGLNEDAERRLLLRQLYCWVEMTPSFFDDPRADSFAQVRGDVLAKIKDLGVQPWEAWACSRLDGREEVLKSIGMSLESVTQDVSAIARLDSTTDFGQWAVEATGTLQSLDRCIRTIEQGSKDDEQITIEKSAEAAQEMLSHLRLRDKAVAERIGDDQERAVAIGLVVRAEWIATKRLALQNASKH